MSGTLTIHRTFFLESDIADGDYPRDDIVTDVWEDVSASEAAGILERQGLSFAATGSDWAADPDGSYITDYRTGQRCETSGHLSGFHPRVHAAIMERAS